MNRYSMTLTYDRGAYRGGEMLPDEAGDWVRHDAVAPILAAARALAEAADLLEKMTSERFAHGDDRPIRDALAAFRAADK